MIKKGELTTQQIVILVIAITSFIILVYLFTQFNFGENTQAELCRNSVLMKGGSIVPDSTTPLNCKRKYLCITEDGSCEGLTDPVVEEVKNVEEVYDVLANEMADCWWMFGEGKIDYVGKDSTKNNYCSICSQVLFDDSLTNLEDVDGTISKDKLYDYLSQKEFSDGERTYAEYLFGTTDLNQLRTLAYEEYGAGDSFGKIKLGEQYFVVMGITSEVSTLGWVLKTAGVGVGLVVVGAVIVSAPVTAPLIAGIVVVGGIGGAGGYAISDILSSKEPEIAAIHVEGNGVPNQFMAPTILEMDSDKFKALNCEEIVTFS